MCHKIHFGTICSSRLKYLFVSFFFECCQRENKFSPFWVYSQWGKLNLIIVSHRLTKLCRII